MVHTKDSIHCSCTNALYPAQAIQWDKCNLTHFSTNFTFADFSWKLLRATKNLAAREPVVGPHWSISRAAIYLDSKIRTTRKENKIKRNGISEQCIHQTYFLRNGLLQQRFVLKLDAHDMRPVRFLSAWVWFRDVTSFFDASRMQSRLHGGALVGLAPQTKLQAPQIETWNTISQWSFA